MSDFNDWIDLKGMTFVRRSSVVGITVVGKEVEIAVAGADPQRFEFVNSEDAVTYAMWLLRKTDDPPEILKAQLTTN